MRQLSLKFYTRADIFSLAKAQGREDYIKESWVKAMELRLVRDELGKCHKAEGVNHYENCRWLSEKYLAMLKINRVSFNPLFQLF